MRHPEGGIGVGIELDGLAFGWEVIERAGLERLPDFAFRDGFPLVQVSVCHKSLFSGGGLGARIEQQLGRGSAQPDLLHLIGRFGVISN
jgi:hypothetical protein